MALPQPERNPQMTPERRREINEAFLAVLDREPAERERYLTEAFAQDAALRREVAQLLRDAEAADNEGFMVVPARVLDEVPLALEDFKHGDSDFSRIEYIGQGGMGVVYKAYDGNFDRWVALKFSAPSRLISAAGVERFRAEAQSMARLRHPNIVTVHETGEHQGRPYFVMDLVEGTSLGESVQAFVEHPREAAALVETIAMAVHHAHQRRILHNDLKPANILIDAEGRPHITDFGLARRLAEGEDASATGAVGGTVGYMSPEQFDGREITTASDVYGLGAILYTLLTGRTPFRGKTVAETVELVRTAQPTSPRALNPRVDRDLEAICLRCLKKQRSERYVSASSLAHDLERHRTGIETIARPWTRWERIVSWCRRNTVEAGLVAGVLAVWIFSLVMALSVAQARTDHLLHATAEGAGLAAKDLAQTALLQLRHLGRNVELAIADGKLAALLENDDRAAMAKVVTDLCSDRGVPFTTCYIINREGVMVAHAPRADHVMGGDFGWRDHFLGAKARATTPGGSAIHVSRAYRGYSDNVYKFAVSAPILDRDHRFLGTIATSVATDASLGTVFLHDDNRKVALVAPTDIQGPAERRSDRHVIVYHPGYRKGIDPVEFPAVHRVRKNVVLANTSQQHLSDSRSVALHDDDYRDPVAAVVPEYAGRWIAGFAPVGNTGFFVVVQQRFDDAVSLEPTTLWSLALWSALASVVVVAILLMVLWQWLRARRKRAGAT